MFFYFYLLCNFFLCFLNIRPNDDPFFNSDESYRKVHCIELYNESSNNTFNNALEFAMKQISNTYQTIFSIQNDLMHKTNFITLLYKKIIALKNESIPIDKKIIKLYQLIADIIPEKKDQDLILKIFKKFLGIFL
jgi:hypothetical protein